MLVKQNNNDLSIDNGQSYSSNTYSSYSSNSSSTSNKTIYNSGGFYFDNNKMNAEIEQLKNLFNGFRRDYELIDNDMKKILNTSIWDSETRDEVNRQYSILQSYYGSVYSTFEKILNFLNTILANYQLMENMSFF